jgi:hypothetical protein
MSQRLEQPRGRECIALRRETKRVCAGVRGPEIALVRARTQTCHDGSQAVPSDDSNLGDARRIFRILITTSATAGSHWEWVGSD